MKTQRKKEWFDDESFWIELYPFIFTEKRLAESVEQVEKILKLANPKGKAILDLCCGPGRVSIPFAARKFKVTGVDRTAFLLTRAKRRARSAKVRIEWVRADMRDFVRPGAFDLVLNLFTSFGYFNNKGEDVIVLRNVLTSLKPGGCLLMDMMGKEVLAKIAQGTTSDVLPNGTKLVQRHEIIDDWTRVRNEWILIRGRAAKAFHFHHTIYSGQELRDRLEQAGLVDVKLYGDFDGGDYGLSAQRLIAVGTRPR